MAKHIKNRLTLLFCLVVISQLNAKDKRIANGDTAMIGRLYNSYYSKLEFKLRDSKLIAVYECAKEVYYPDKSQLSYNTQVFNYSDYYYKVIKRQASVKYPKGNSYKTKKVKKYYASVVAESHVFYEDVIQESWYYPNLKEGCITNLNVVSELSDPVLTPNFYFNLELMTKAICYKVVIPDGVKVKTVLYGDSTGIEHTVMKTKTGTIHTYSCTNRSAIVHEENSSHYRYYTPHLIVIPESYEQNGGIQNLAGNLPNLFKMYNSNLKEMPKSDNTIINKLTDSLTKQISDTAEIIHTIFNWVQKNIQYIAFEEGRGGFVPRPADKVLHNKYGDCKDKTNLLVTMLGSAGINAFYTWVGSRNKPYKYTDLPSPHADDHLIATVKYKNEWLFLDATAPNIEYKYPSSFIQGKQAFIRLNDSMFTIEEVPIIKPHSSLKTDSIRITIKDNVVKGSGKQNVSGYFKEKYLNALHYSSKNDIELIKEELKIGNNKLVLSNFQRSKFTSSELQFSYDLVLPNYLQEFEGDQYLNLNLIKDYENNFIDIKERKLDFSEDFRFTLVQYIELDVMDTKLISQVPNDYSYSNEDFSFSIKYKTEKNKLILDKTISINHLTLDQKKFDDWNEMVGKLSKAYSEVIVIKNNKK